MFRKLHKFLKKLPVVAKAAPLAIMILAIPVMVAAYGPSRPTFDYNKYDPSDPTCRAASNDHGRCGSMSGPVFNSFINVPAYGDERDFATLSEATAGDTNPIDNSYDNDFTTQAGKEYWMRVYVHNNANSATNNEDLNHDGFPDGVARNTRVKVSFLSGRANALDIKATVTADNATTVWDEGVLRDNNEQFRVEYVAGSALLLNAAQPNVLRPLSDDVAGANGAQIGYDQLNGNLPGCFDYVTRVYVKVRVKAPKVIVKKVAFRSGTQEILNNQTVDPSTSITYKSFFYNIGNDVADDVTLRDRLAAGSTFVPGTLKLYTSGGVAGGAVLNGTQENGFFNLGGINVGSYLPLSDAQRAIVLANHADPSTDPYSGQLTYRTTIKDDKSVCELTNVVYVRVPGAPEYPSTSVVQIDRNGSKAGNGCNETPPEHCDVKGKENLPKNSPDCVTTTTTLPNTGPGNVLGLFAFVSVAGGLFHRYFLGRKFQD